MTNMCVCLCVLTFVIIIVIVVIIVMSDTTWMRIIYDGCIMRSLLSNRLDGCV